MPCLWVFIQRISRRRYSVRATVDILLNILFLAIRATRDMTVLTRKDATIRRVTVAVTGGEEGLGIGLEAGTRIADDLVERLPDIKCSELILTACLAHVFVVLGDVEVCLFGDCVPSVC